jgi:hypothetical protein
MLTCERKVDFKIFVTGTEWTDKYSIDNRKPSFVKAIYIKDVGLRNSPFVINRKDLNIYSIMIEDEGFYYYRMNVNDITLDKSIVS